MRTIVSQHQDETSLRASLFHGASGEGEAFEFVTFCCPGETTPGESVQLVVGAGAQRVSLHVTLVARRAGSSAGHWEYLARVDAADRVWLEMMLRKLRTLRRFAA